MSGDSVWRLAIRLKPGGPANRDGWKSAELVPPPKAASLQTGTTVELGLMRTDGTITALGERGAA